MLVRVESCVVLGGVRYNRGTHEIQDSVCRGDVFERLVKFRKVIVVEPSQSLVPDPSESAEESSPKRRGRKPKESAVVEDAQEHKADDAEVTEETEAKDGE